MGCFDFISKIVEKSISNILFKFRENMETKTSSMSGKSSRESELFELELLITDSG